MSIIEKERQAEEVEGPITEREHRARTLEAAALEIEVRGWTRENYCNSSGAVCLLGALIWTLGADPAGGVSIIGTFDDKARLAFGDDDYGLAEFNDNIAESADDVTFLLRWRASEIRDGR